MKRNVKRKFKKKGDINDVLVVALPMLLSMSFDTLMTFIDRLFLSRVGPEYMNAALGGSGAQMIFLTFFIGLIAYATALVAQNLGAKRNENCAKVLSQTLYFSLLSAPILIALVPLGYYAFSFENLEPLQLSEQKDYFAILMYGSVIALLRNSFSSFFSGIGEAKIIMQASFVSMIVNIIANYFLIYGHWIFPAMNARGAAYGTLLGNGTSLAILALKYFSKDLRTRFNTAHSFSIDKPLIRELFRKGGPSGIEMFSNMTAFQMLLFLFHGTGPVAATAASIMFNWDMVAYVPLMGLEIASMSLVGRYIGAKSPAAAKRSTFSGLHLGWAYSAFIFIAFVFLPGPLVDFFKPDTASALFDTARPIAIFMVRIAAIYVTIEVLLVIYGGALRGAGDTIWVMFAMSAMNWTCALLLWIAAYVIKFPPHYCWLVVVCTYSSFPIVFFLRWRKEKWRKAMQI